jgi:hypothetical protein
VHIGLEYSRSVLATNSLNTGENPYENAYNVLSTEVSINFMERVRYRFAAMHLRTLEVDLWPCENEASARK